MSDTDVDYPTDVSAHGTARAQAAVNGVDRLRDRADHNRWKNAIRAGLDLFGA